MYWIRKSFFLRILACTVIFLIGCKTQEISLQATEWKLLHLGQDDVSMLQNPVTLTFTENESRISGFGGCNRYFGSFSQSGNRISFTGVGSTKMYCDETMNVEDTFFRLLNEVDAFNVQGEKLVLLKGATPLLEFTRGR
ncbi:MAG: META domain-containing protein [Flammeovirgaceae bacterium]|nr:MAG: META domain-containing protein [Flammeovirgaceae bacterium]